MQGLHITQEEPHAQAPEEALPADRATLSVTLYNARQQHAIDMDRLLGLTHGSMQDAIERVQDDTQLRLEILDFLLSCGALVPSIATVIASIGSDAELMQWLLQHGASPHCLSAALEQPGLSDACFRLLLQHGAAVDSDSCSTHAPLHHAIAPGRLHRMQLLLAHGADPRGTNFFSTVCYHLADSAERVMATRALIDAKADVNGSEGDRPLTSAILFGCWDVMSLLLMGGADPNHDDYLCRVCEAPYGATECLAAVTLLLQHGANVNGTPGRRPLRWALAMAVTAEDLEPARLLLQHRADINTLYDDEQYLVQAVQHPSLPTECTRLLLEHGADPAAEDSQGRLACMHCSPCAAAHQLLLSALPPSSERADQEERNSSPQSSVPEQSEDAWQLEPWSWDPQVRRAQQAELRRIIGSGVARPSDRVASHGALTDNLALVDVLAQTSLPRLIEESHGNLESITAQDLLQLASTMAVSERGRSHSAPLMHPSLLRSMLASPAQLGLRKSG